jgi:hypothetical protein
MQITITAGSFFSNQARDGRAAGVRMIKSPATQEAEPD